MEWCIKEIKKTKSSVIYFEFFSTGSFFSTIVGFCDINFDLYVFTVLCSSFCY